MFQVAKEDHGKWMCLVNDNEEFNAVKNFVTLHIGVEADMGINVHGGDLMSRERILRLVEGEGVDIKCYANNGYPPANFIWLAPIRKNLSASLQIFEASFI
jgi:hypothetical protein